MPVISTFGVNYYPLVGGFYFYKTLDQGWAEYFGAQKIYRLLSFNSSRAQILIFNRIKIFFVLILIWFFVIFIFYLNSLSSERDIEDVGVIINF